MAVANSANLACFSDIWPGLAAGSLLVLVTIAVASWAGSIRWFKSELLVRHDMTVSSPGVNTTDLVHLLRLGYSLLGLALVLSLRCCRP